uniref:Uncharacterized protein n=1 Tax=Rhizophora mucronata TaxID=61149 RepID=A0A2P2PAG5_RHIMU
MKRKQRNNHKSKYGSMNYPIILTINIESNEHEPFITIALVTK